MSEPIQPTRFPGQVSVPRSMVERHEPDIIDVIKEDTMDQVRPTRNPTTPAWIAGYRREPGSDTHWVVRYSVTGRTASVGAKGWAKRFATEAEARAAVAWPQGLMPVVQRVDGEG